MHVSTYSILSTLVFITAAGFISHLVIMLVGHLLLMLLAVIETVVGFFISIIPDLILHLQTFNHYFTVVVELFIIGALFSMNIKEWKPGYCRYEWFSRLPQYYLQGFLYICQYLKYLISGTMRKSDVIIKKLK